MKLSNGDQAPDFTLVDENEKEHTLSDYRGKPVVLFFYPRDDTPGCTIEVCNFRDDYSAYQGSEVTLLGVSVDSSKSHTKFINKFELPFSLLADTGKEVVNQYGVWKLKKQFGREFEGISRTTFLIDVEGNIAKVFENVKPDIHSEEVLEAISNL